MTWQHFAVPGKPGVFRLHRDGVEAGDLALDHPYATVLAGHVVAALNDFDQTVTRTQRDMFRLRGWHCEDQYRAQVALNRDLLKGFPSAHAEVKAAADRHGWEFPLTPEEMSAWQDELLDILITHEQPDHGVFPNDSELLDIITAGTDDLIRSDPEVAA
jgi:hypothetical protein